MYFILTINKNRKHLFIVLVTVLIAFSCNQKSKESALQRERLFDSEWRFIRDSVAGAEQPGYDDSQWRLLDLPHDWSIEDLPAGDSIIGPFSKKSGGPMNGASTGHTIGGTGWYRKSFTLNNDDKDKLISVYFEGAYMETDVWVNGNYIGNHKHGYTSFYFDITNHCKAPGEKNVIAVRVMNSGQNSRWYSGSGIYRHVKMIVTNPVHISQWGVKVTTPQVAETEASVNITTAVANERADKASVKILTRIMDAENHIVAESENPLSINENKEAIDSHLIAVKSPKHWSIDSPYLYKAEVTVLVNDKVEDISTTDFGIRTIHFSAANGFMLNGEKMELKGGCFHHDNGILGAAVIDRAEERKVELLKSAGFNAVRCSHYPPSEKFLETCDRLGMLVIDEAFDMWQKPKNKDDYHLFFDEWWERDLSSIILRDRNHPSIILWNLGNEIEERADSSGVELMKKFRTVINKFDSTRLLTLAVNEFWDHPGRKWPQTAPAFARVDVGGYNYQWWQYEPDHQQFPNRIMLGTESVPIHAFQNWQLVEKYPYVIGNFVWTAMDYLGESGIGHTACEEKGKKDSQLQPWPWFNANCGDIDLIGNKKPQSYYRDVVWRRTKIEMAVHAPFIQGCKEFVSYWGWPDEQQSWTWPSNEGKMMDINVYSRFTKVRLLLNGKMIAEKNTDSLLTAKFQLPFAPGELKAAAIEAGKETASVVLFTAGIPQRLNLKVDRQQIKNSRNDLAYVTVEVLDDKNNVVPYANLPVEFSITGAGEIAAVGNANPSDMASFHKSKCNTYRGRCLMVVRPKGAAGDIILEAKAEGLPPIKTIVTAKNK
jgi:beta-galactosidase